MSKRRVPQGRSTKRSAAKQLPKVVIYAVCEGKNTEPDYLIEFARHYGNNLVKVSVTGAAGAPVTLVDKAVDKKKELDQLAKKSGNSFDGLHQVWAVFDVDDHPNIPQAVNKAQGNNIGVALSNPCFEIWPLLHIQDHAANIHRHNLQKLLESVMPNYDGSGAKVLDYQQIKDSYLQAKVRAVRLLASHEAVGTPNANPSTNVFQLLDEIVKNGKA